ncbi:MAG TPA: PP2C family protein-serine/threonine phosphatase [Blastocatellia bacterium]|nr:PP2C family protein-serine/threonine phosphatase [Blastocatellia bacterium]
MRRLLIPLLLAVAGYGAFALLFSRLDPAARWQQTIDRQQAIARANEIAARYGLETRGWDVVVTTGRNREAERYLLAHPQSEIAPLLSPLVTTVTMGTMHGERSFRVSLAADGHLLSLIRREPEKTGQAPTGPPTAAEIEAALKDLTGSFSPRFTQIKANSQGQGSRKSPERFGAFVVGSDRDKSEKGDRRFTQEFISSGQDQVKFTTEAVVAGSIIKELRLAATLPARFLDEVAFDRSTSVVVIGGLTVALVVLLTLGGLVLYFFGLARREVDWRNALAFLVTITLLMITANYLGGATESLRAELTMGETPGFFMRVALPLLISFLLLLQFLIPLLVCWGGALALYARTRQGRPAGLAAMLRGRLWSRATGTYLAAGMLLGGIIAALPFLIAGSRIFPGSAVDAENIHRIFASKAPALAALTSPAATNTSGTFLLFLVFGFLVPLLGSYLTKPLLARLLSVVVGALLLASVFPLGRTSLASALAGGLLLMVTGEQIWRRFDLLTVVMASVSAEVALRIAALLAQPSAALRLAGVTALTAMGLLFAFALVAAWKGRATAPEADAALLRAGTLIEDRAERERLKAEFNVAQRAQQQMLPAVTPDLPGFHIAAICRPSREVGGDLYDFIPLPDGKLGIVVADVSGKGVPASLYMTLTKGLMLSVAEEQSDPGAVLREVNKHLYEACQRKMFVTLFYGVLDPRTRTLTCSRAGHNPPIWRRTSEQTTLMLKPPGPGLGLVSGQSFDRVLKVEQISLSPHDTLFLYSDGITEAMNEHQEEYGEARLMAVAERADWLDAEMALNAVLGDVSAFLAGTPPQDDQTLVVVRVAGN